MRRLSPGICVVYRTRRSPRGRQKSPRACKVTYAPIAALRDAGTSTGPAPIGLTSEARLSAGCEAKWPVILINPSCFEMINFILKKPLGTAVRERDAVLLPAAVVALAIGRPHSGSRREVCHPSEKLILAHSAVFRLSLRSPLRLVGASLSVRWRFFLLMVQFERTAEERKRPIF